MTGPEAWDEFGSVYHRPVMWREVARHLITDKNGIYIDGTLGGGGHSELILRNISSRGRLIALDRDDEALDFAGKRLEKYSNFIPAKAVFADMAAVAMKNGVAAVNGILLDLGISSHQIDTAERGFAFSADGPLDMRMDRNTSLTAEEILNSYDENLLADIFYRYGEERRSRAIASSICKQRKLRPFKTTGQLKEVITGFYPPNKVIKAYARVFQALRIFINGELEQLEKALEEGFNLLKKGGRLAVISYHSLEDRLVKQQYRYWEKECVCDPALPVCQCDKVREVKIIRPFPMVAADDETADNSRARSARLRICEKAV
jgi:16S rRNA (cytosine1402-N4)-methyltransferase